MSKRKRLNQKKRVPAETMEPAWIDWHQVGPTNWHSISWSLRLRAGGRYHVRLVGKPISFFRCFANDKSVIIVYPAGCPIAMKYNLKPIRRYTINVIFRGTGMLHCIEGPEELFLEFRRFYELTGVDPGGPEGCDFEMTLTSDKGKTHYNVTYDIRARSPFTEEEKKLIRQNILDLPRIYAPTPNDEIESKLGLATGRGDGLVSTQSQGVHVVDGGIPKTNKESQRKPLSAKTKKTTSRRQAKTPIPKAVGGRRG